MSKESERSALKVMRLQGPILVLGGSGFVGANLFRLLFAVRKDVFATTSGNSNWRLEDLPKDQVIESDLLSGLNLERVLNKIQPRTVFNCLAYGAYSFETDEDRIYRTNFLLTRRILSMLRTVNLAAYIHAGSSSEYGDNCSGPDENALAEPNSDYAVSKFATSQLLKLWGTKYRFPCANLRIYSAFGPWEDSSRLIPTLVVKGLAGEFPALVNADISHDFVWIDDVCLAFIDCALNLNTFDYGGSFNIGTGRKLTIREVAEISRSTFDLQGEPTFGSMTARLWDVHDWYANPQKAQDKIGWKATTSFEKGLEQMVEWYKAFPQKEKYHRLTKKFSPSRERSISAVIACYKDAKAIPFMYSRLKAVFTKLNVEHEIIFVNDGSPDDSEEVISKISSVDSAVIGITHSRNFGSQAAFISGLQIATKNGCVLLDGDLQDPPECIENFFAKWEEGYEVIYGERVDREGTLFMRLGCKVFYRLFNKLSNIYVPRDAGDFSLIDRRVVAHILKFPERDLFLRGVRAFVGFSQIGIPYHRPERMFGVSTNNFLRNIGWAKKGILSYSNTPLNLLSLSGVILFLLSAAAGILQLTLRLVYPEIAPRGATTVLLVIIFFGSINLLSLGLIGEYVGRIFEETKARPLFIRKLIISNGEKNVCD